jgi:acetyl-CoA carboxylase biotin carboxyl carrier protein
MTKFDVDEALVRKLAKLLKETDLSEIEFESEGRRIRVNSGKGTATTMVHQAPPAAAAVQAAPAAPAADGPPKNALTSPMVGTAYLSPEPNAAPFVAIGDRVAKGQTLLVIEAMKVMNPIAAPDGGTVKAVYISDAQPVEFGEPLMLIE